jgi:putative peptide zinc metalloprotease protein
MSEETRTFSEVWYRVAQQVVTLRPRVEVRRQVFRGERWHVLHDPFNNQFFRLRPEAYAFVARLRPGRTVEEVWRECLEADPESAPGQEDVVQLLAQLYHANLLHYRMAADSEKFFERYRKRRQRERMFTWWNLMFARFPLFDPDALLERAQPWLRWLLRPWAAVAWVLVAGAALATIAAHAGEFAAAAGSVLAPRNLLLLYLGTVLLKLLHEFGHAAACKHFGGEVHTMGVMLLVFSPLPYVDVTASWAFRERWKRVAVAAAGMAAEGFAAALAAFVWAGTGPGAVRDLAFNMMIAAGVTTVLFNGNPLLRYDGYYILSDLADIPNLFQRAQQMLRHLGERHLFGLRRSRAPAEERREVAWLVGYGVASLAYRVVVFAGIVWFVSGRFLLLGLLMAVFCAVAWLAVPLGKFIGYLASGPGLERVRGRAAGVSLAIGGALALVLGAVPAPQSLRAPGVLRAVAAADAATGVEGALEALCVPSGARVEAGQAVARLRNPELDLQIAGARAQAEEIQAAWRAALRQAPTDRAGLEQALEAVRARLATLEERAAKRIVTAPITGTWVAPEAAQGIGMWLPRGATLGQIVGGEGFEFSAIVPQGSASRLFAGEAGRAEVRLAGQSEHPIRVVEVVVVPAGQSRLPSAALAQGGGGEVALARDARGEAVAAEAFYEVRARLAPEPNGDVVLLQGLTGRIAFRLPAEPLGVQWMRALRQLLQKRVVE